MNSEHKIGDLLFYPLSDGEFHLAILTEYGEYDHFVSLILEGAPDNRDDYEIVVSKGTIRDCKENLESYMLGKISKRWSDVNEF